MKNKIRVSNPPSVIMGVAMTDAKAGQIVRVNIGRTSLDRCEECGCKLKTKEEKEFGQCDKCCAWKYRENS